MSTAVLRRRPARVIPASIVAILIAAAGAGLITLAILRLQGGQWPSPATAMVHAGELTWASPLVAATAAVAVAIGLVLVLCAVLPGRPSNRAAISPGDTEAAVTRRGIERLVEHRIDAVDGVGSCRARLRGRRLSVVVHTPLRKHADLAAAVTAAADDVLRNTVARATPRTSVRTVSSS